MADEPDAMVPVPVRRHCMVDPAVAHAAGAAESQMVQFTVMCPVAVLAVAVSMFGRGIGSDCEIAAAGNRS